MLEEMNPFTVYDILTFCSSGNPARQRLRCPVCDSNDLTAEDSITDRLPVDRTILVKLMKLIVRCRDCDYIYESENLDRAIRLS